MCVKEQESSDRLNILFVAMTKNRILTLWECRADSPYTLRSKEFVVTEDRQRFSSQGTSMGSFPPSCL